jgi:peptide/nickel transport system substrate-binding protein
MVNRLIRPVLLCVVLLVGCAPSGTGSNRSGSEPQGQARQSSGPKTLVAAINEDPRNMWDGINGGGGGGAREIGHMLNQYLANIGPDGTPVPRLLAEFPSVQNGTWQVMPDGRMEVTYKLRPGVTWHDGTPFTADDVAFSWEVGRDPNVPNGNQLAVRLIDSFEAKDPLTAVATWTQTYAFADRLEHREFFPLPKHLVEPSYRESKETLIAQPYFSDRFIGVGPFKLTSWEHGSYMEMVANDAYFLGRPKLDRVRVMFIPDTNTGVANLRAGQLNIFLPSGGPDWDQLETVDHEWKTTRKGEVVLERVRWVFMEPQKSAAATPADLRDVRMRQALLMATNREELSRSLQGEHWGVAHSFVHPSISYYSQIKDAITEYPFDRRRASAMLTELGWTPGPDGILQKGGTRFQVGLRTEEAREKEAAIVQQDWKAIGIEGEIDIMSNVLLRDAQARATYSGVALNQNPMGGVSAVRRFSSEQIPTPANRFAGTNRGSYANPEWDDVGLRLRTALDDTKRTELERELLRILTTDLPAMPIQYELQAIPTSGFKGFVPVTGAAHTGNIMHTTNIHEWDI